MKVRELMGFLSKEDPEMDVKMGVEGMYKDIESIIIDDGVVVLDERWIDPTSPWHVEPDRVIWDGKELREKWMKEHPEEKRALFPPSRAGFFNDDASGGPYHNTLAFEGVGRRVSLYSEVEYELGHTTEQPHDGGKKYRIVSKEPYTTSHMAGRREVIDDSGWKYELELVEP